MKLRTLAAVPLVAAAMFGTHRGGVADRWRRTPQARRR